MKIAFDVDVLAKQMSIKDMEIGRASCRERV